MYVMSSHLFGRLNVKATFMIPMLLISMFTVISMATTQTAIQIEPTIAKLSPILLEKISTLGNGPVNVLIETAGKDYSNVISIVNTLGGTVRHQFKYVNALAATLPANMLTLLAKHNDIVRIYYDSERKLASSRESIMMGPRNLNDLDELLTQPIVMESKDYVPISIKPAELTSIEPVNYWNTKAMGAEEIWEETNYGEGSLVVIIDTGIWTGHFMFAETDIIGGIDMSYDVGTEYEGWDHPWNHPHGGHVAGTIASTGGIIVPPDDPLALAIERYTGTTLPPGDPYGYPGWKVIWLLGMAPGASLYIIKVFDHTGAGIPEAMVIAAMEHALDLKLVEGIDVDVISMSLGGPTLYDGRDVEDKLVDTITSHGITLVAAAGNEGPASMTTASPGSAYTTITVGAAANPVNTRVFWDVYYDWPGLGYYLFTSEVPQIYAFSSRGPTSDGRSKPTLSATGIFVLSAYTTGGVQAIAWFSGTSMATPAVSGSVALLNAFAETARGKYKRLVDATPEDYKQALVNGAVWLEGYTEWDQGAGYLNAANALEALKADESIGDVAPPLPPTGELMDITNIPIVGEGTYTASITDLAPGHKVEFIFEITPASHWVKLEITNVNLGVYNPLGLNSFEIYIQSAKRTYYGYYIDSANVWGDAWFMIHDDNTKWRGAITGVFLDPYTRVIEPGYMKIVIENDWTSADVISGDIKITVRAEIEPTPDVVISGEIIEGEWVDWMYISVPAGTKEAAIELRWVNDWTKYPTSDLDLYVYWDEGYNFKGATLNSPERVTLDKPTFIYVALYGYTVYEEVSPEPFELLVWFER
jgi:subtilisin family serine protease